MHATRPSGLGFNNLEVQIWTGVIPQVRAWIDDPALTPTSRPVACEFTA